MLFKISVFSKMSWPSAGIFRLLLPGEEKITGAVITFLNASVDEKENYEII